MRRILGLFVAVAALLTVVAAPARAELVWDIQTVDSDAYPGEDRSLALDASDYPHVAYADYVTYDLNYASWQGSYWTVETVDSTGVVGTSASLALDANDYPRISYYDSTNDDLKYASWSGSSWSVETVDSGGDVGMHTSLALDSDGYAHISYLDYSNYALKYTYWNGSSWATSTVDSGGDVGSWSSLALDSSGNAHISYYATSPKHDLKYARFDGTSWHIETPDADTVGQHTSLCLDADGRPHISYDDHTAWNSGIRYAYWDGTSWQIQVVDSGVLNANFGQSSLVLAQDGSPRISYHHRTVDSPRIRYAWWDGSSWRRETIAAGIGLLCPTSLALDAAGWPHVSYYSGGDLYYAVGTPEPATCVLALLALGFGGSYVRRHRRRKQGAAGD